MGASPVPPNSFVRELLSAAQDDVGTCIWTRRPGVGSQLRWDGSASAWRPADATVANLLLTGQMLIEARNLLTHYHPLFFLLKSLLSVVGGLVAALVLLGVLVGAIILLLGLLSGMVFREDGLTILWGRQSRLATACV